MKTIDIPIVGPSNDIPQDDPQRTLNFYPEKTGDTWTLKPTPGAELYASLGVNGGGRGAVSVGGRLFGVRGASFQEIVGGVAVVRGTLLSTQGAVGILGEKNAASVSATVTGQVLIVDDDHGYVYEFDGDTFTTLTEGTHGFVGGLGQVAFAGGYALAIKPNTNQSGFSALYNFLDWPGTNFIGLQNTSGNMVALTSTEKSVTFFTQSGFEVWTTEGYTGNFAFTQIVSGFGIGCQAPRSVTTFQKYTYWLGANAAGKDVVYRYTEGGTPQPISNFSNDRKIASVSDPSDAVGYNYQSLGHTFYVLTFIGGNFTVCYDESTKEWHDRAWRDPLTNYMYAVPYITALIHDGQLLGLDQRDGKFFEISNDVYTDNGAPIRRERILPVIPNEADWMTYCGTLELFCTVGNTPVDQTDPMVMLSYSTNRGMTYGQEQWCAVGGNSSYTTRVRWTVGGAAFGFVFKLAIVANQYVSWRSVRVTMQ